MYSIRDLYHVLYTYNVSLLTQRQITQMAWIPGVQWPYMQSVHNSEGTLLYQTYYTGKGEVGMMAGSAWANLTEVTEEMSSPLAWSRWDERACHLEKHVKATKRWREVDRFEAY